MKVVCVRARMCVRALVCVRGRAGGHGRGTHFLVSLQLCHPNYSQGFSVKAGGASSGGAVAAGAAAGAAALAIAVPAALPRSFTFLLIAAAFAFWLAAIVFSSLVSPQPIFKFVLF